MAHPIYASVDEMTKIIGLGRSSIYEMLARGEISAVRFGKRTLVSVASAQEFLASQPPAVFTYTGKAA